MATQNDTNQTPETDMTQEQTKRTIEALSETNRLLDREMSYQPQFRKMDQIAFYEKHIAKLTSMLEGSVNG